MISEEEKCGEFPFIVCFLRSIMKTKIISIRNFNALSEAVRVLRRGGIIVYPSESCYGLGADATSLAAVKKIQKLKKQSSRKPISVILDSEKTAKKHAELNPTAKIMIRKLMPGPITIICARKGNDRSIGFRIPGDRFSLKLVKKFKKPITATSANIHGKPAIYNISEIRKQFEGKVDLIIDAGNLKRRKLSTVFDTKTMKILRKGAVSEKKILKIINSHQ